MRAGLATCLRRGERSGPGRWSTTKNGRTAAWDTGHRGSSREKWRQTAVEKELGGTPWKTGFPPSLEIPQRARNSHFPTASSAVLPPLKRTQKKSGKSYDHVRRVWGQVTPRPALSGPNQEWALDFVHDAAESGRAFRALSVLDVYTRECLALEVDTSFASRRLTRVLGEILLERGQPAAIRCDNGPEFTSRHFLAWCVERSIELVHIEPGKPVQNAHVESFHGRLREECLNASWFGNLFEARRKIGAWKVEYNEERPHSSLGYRTPREFAREVAANGCGKGAGWNPLENGVPTQLGNSAKSAEFPLSHSLVGGLAPTKEDTEEIREVV